MNDKLKCNIAKLLDCFFIGLVVLLGLGIIASGFLFLYFLGGFILISIASALFLLCPIIGALLYKYLPHDGMFSEDFVDD